MATPEEVFKEFYKPKPGEISEPPEAAKKYLGTGVTPRYDPEVLASDFILNDLKKYWGGFLGLPIDLINEVLKTPQQGIMGLPFMAARGMNVGEVPGGSKDIQGLLGYEPGMKPPSPGVKFGSKVIGNTSLQLPFMLLPQSRLMQAAQLVSGPTSAVGEIVGEEAFPNSPTAQFFTQLAPALAPTLLASRVDAAREVAGFGLDRASREKAKAFAGGLKERYARWFSEKTIERSAESMDPLRLGKELDESARLEQRFPGLRYTVGQRIGTPESRSIERGLATSGRGALNERYQMDLSNREVIYGEKTKIPTSQVSLEGAITQPKTARDTALRSLERQISKLDDQAEDLALNLGGRRPEEVGRELRAIRTGEKKLARVAVRENFAEVDRLADKYKATVNAKETLDLIDEISRNPLFKFDKDSVPSVIIRAKDLEVTKKFIRSTEGRFLGGSEPAVDFKEIKALREAVGDDIAVELSSNRVNNRRLRSLFQVRNSIDASMDQMGKTGFGDLNDSYKTAIKHYRENFVPRFERGVNLKMQLLNSLGDPRIPDEKVIEAYFKKGGVTPVRQFKALFGDHPAAVNALEDGVLQKFSKSVLDSSGQIDAGKYQKFLKDFDAPLNELPNLKKKLLDSGSAADAISVQRQILFDQQGDIAKSKLSRLLKIDEPDGILNAAMKDPKAMRELLGQMNQEGRTAVFSRMMNRAFDDNLIATTEFKAVDPAKLGKFLTENEKSLMEVFTAALGPKQATEHMSYLKDIQQAVARIERTPVSPLSTEGVPSVEVDPLKAKTGVGAQSVFAAARAAGAGRGSYTYFGGVLGTQMLNFFSQRQVMELTKQAMYDPETAKLLRAGLTAQSLTPELQAGLKGALSKVGYVIAGGKNVAAMSLAKASTVGISGRSEKPPTTAPELGLDVGEPEEELEFGQ